MKINITNDNASITLFERCQNDFFDLYKKQNLTLGDREKINAMLLNDDLFKDHVLSKNMGLDECPDMEHLWFNAIVLYQPFKSFISKFLEYVIEIKLKYNIDAVFFLDLWPVIIAIKDENEIEFFYNSDNTDVVNALQILSLGFSK